MRHLEYELRATHTHLADVQEKLRGWNPRQKRYWIATAAWRARLAAARLRGRMTGIRLFVTARREAAG